MGKQARIPLARGEEEHLLDTKLKAEWTAPTNYTKAKGYLHSGSQIIVPEGLQKLVVQQYHDGFHLGESKTDSMIRRRFHWKGIQKQVKKVVRECPVCQKCKPKRTRKAGLLRPLSIPRQRWQSIGIDFLCGLPIFGQYNMIAVVVCRLT